MAKSLAEAGLTARPRFIRAADIADRDIRFEILGARQNPNGYNGTPEVVFTIRCVGVTEDQAFFDQEGNELTALPALSMSLSVTESRSQVCDYFRDPTAEPLGPLCFERIAPTRPGMSAFLHIVDDVPLVAGGQPITNGQRPQAVPSGGQPRTIMTARQRAALEPPVRPDDDDDLPF